MTLLAVNLRICYHLIALFCDAVKGGVSPCGFVGRDLGVQQQLQNVRSSYLWQVVTSCVCCQIEALKTKSEG